MLSELRQSLRYWCSSCAARELVHWARVGSAVPAFQGRGAVGEGRGVGRIQDRGGLEGAWHDVMWLRDSSHLCTRQHVVL